MGDSLGASDAASVGSDFNAAQGRVDIVKSRLLLCLKYAITGKAYPKDRTHTLTFFFLIKPFLWHFQQSEHRRLL